MRLDDFVNMVEHNRPSVELINFNHDNRRRGSTIEINKLESVLVHCISQANILAGNTMYYLSGNYRSIFGQRGICFIKTDFDYQADDTHYVYRCRLALRTGAQLQRNRSGQQSNQAANRNEAISALRTTIEATRFTSIGEKEIEVTVTGRFNDSNLPARTGSTNFNENWYSMTMNNLQEWQPSPYSVNKRGEIYSMFDEDGLAGEMTIQIVDAGAQLRTLTEQDIQAAERFSIKERPYTGWIPTTESASVIHSGPVSFYAYRTGDCNTALKGTELKDKVIDRRVHFNGTTQFLIGDKRYSVEKGVYFFCPAKIDEYDVFQYDDWLNSLSQSMTMTRVQSRVGFMSNFSSTDEVVKTTKINKRNIQASSSDVEGPKFTGKANSNRLK